MTKPARRPAHIRKALGAFVVLAGMAAATAVLAQSALPSDALRQLQNSTSAHFRTGAYDAAMTDAGKALAMAVKEFGPEHEQIAIRTYSLGLIAEAAGKWDLAAGHYRHSVNVREKVYGPESAGAAQAMEMLGRVLLRAGRISEAEAQFQRVLKIRSDLVGGGHSFTASARADLGQVQLARGNAEAAAGHFRNAIRLLTSDNPEQTVARAVQQDTIRRQRAAFTGLAAALWAMRSAPGARRAPLLGEGFAASQQAWTTSAASALLKMAARLGAADTALGRRVRQVQDLSERVLKLHEADMSALAQWSQVQRADQRYSEALAAFRQASATRQRDNAPIVSQQKMLVGQLQNLIKRCPPDRKLAGCEGSAAELAGISDRLKALSADTQKDSAAIMAVHQRLQAAEQALTGYQAFQSARQQRLIESQRLEQQLREEKDGIALQFPDFIALTEPKPLTPVETQALLGPEEALVAFLVGEDRSYVWAINAKHVAWAEIDAGEKVLAEHVAQLRRGLDPLSVDPRTGRSNVAAVFDTDRAYLLYRLLLGPVATLLAGKQHVLVVPTGPLASLPFHVLVAEKPISTAGAEEKQRTAKWLLQRHGLSVLPSVQSLQALRKFAPTTAAPKPFIGIGDPALKGPLPAPSQQARGGGARGAAMQVRALRPAALYRGGAVDLRALNELVPLPDTANELRTIARALGAAEADVLLREAATETRIKQTVLSDYRVVQFATHGLVAGELSGLSEPALVLTPPSATTVLDDGLLNASEVAALKLRADWVVLSACNTAAGDVSGADALSGLARAFFYAGARALMVSHWAVYSDAAVTLTTGTFGAMANNPRLGRAEAFRRTMLGMIAKGEPPSVWAPFVIVGEAGNPRPPKK